MIFILNKQEKVINILKNGGSDSSAPPFFDDVFTQDLNTGAETFSFSTIAMGNVARDLSVGNYVAFRDEEKQYRLFQIIQTEESHEDAMYVSVYSEGAGLELINKVFRARKTPSVSLRKFMEMVLDETGWNVGAIPFSSQDSLDLDLPDATVYSTLQSTLIKYGVEMSFRVEINQGRVSSKFIDLYKQRGRVTGKRFEFGKDIEGIKRKVDSTELFTALIGRGNGELSFKDITVPEIEKPLGQDFVVNEESFNRYNNNGYHIMGIFKYDTDSPEELLRATHKRLQDCKQPKIEYEVSVALLGKLLGETWNNVSIGDTVAIVDNSFNPPIHLMARVSKLDKSFTNPQGDSCTLANFIEVKSNITDEMREIAKDLEGYVDSKFPIKNEDISEGAVTGDKIYKDTISTDHLIADAVTANKIKAESIETKHLQADSIESQHIKAEQIEAEHIKAGTITGDKITSDEFITNSAQIKDGIIGTAQIGDAEITVAKIQDLFVDNLVANQGKFQSAHIGELTSDNIVAGAITTEKLDAEAITTEKLSAGSVTADKIQAGAIESDKIDAGAITADKIQAGAITTDKLNAEAVNADKISANAITTDKLSANSVTAEKIKADSITTDKITAGAVNADKISANAITSDKIGANQIEAEHIKAGTITSDQINANTINAIGISASEITADKIASGEIQVGNANIVDGTISGAKISNASIDNAHIKDATIESAKIKEIYAGKIKSGTVETGELDISSIDGSLKIKGNTIQIKDNQSTPVTRVQIGKDSRNKYGIVVVNEKSQAIFDSEKGVLSPEGLSDGIISEDKIVDNAIGSSKLNVDELFVGENAFISRLKAVEIDASNITTGKISGERIDISGLISFESLNSDLQQVFDVTGDKTYINGGMIATNTIKADKIDLLSGLTVQRKDGSTTLAVTSDGEVNIDGRLQSANFDDNKNVGYKITTDGTAILNQARVSGEFVMPNAGITNYGATIGNDNLFNLSNVENQSYAGGNITNLSYYKVTGNKIIATSQPQNSHLIGCWTNLSSKQYTISGVTDLKTVNVYYMAKGESEQSSFNIDTDSNGYFERTFDLVGVGEVAFGLGSISVQDYWMSHIKLEKGDKTTPWCPHKDEQFDYTRIWAGSSYINRDSAPFRVTQKGDVWATNATLSGRLLGDYDNGKVHIHNNEIVINNTSTFMAKDGQIENDKNRHHNKDAHIMLGTTQSMLNTNVIFGTLENKRIEYLNDSRLLSFNNSGIVGTKSNGDIRINNSSNESFEGLELSGKSGGRHSVGYWDKASFLRFCSKGSASHPSGKEYDFVFEGTNGRAQKISFLVDGDATINNAIKSNKQNIEMRSIANEGWGFYAT